MANTARLSPDEAYQLKQELFGGVDYKTLQEKYGVSYQIVVGVRAGRAYAHVPWPDGSSGALSDLQQQKLANSKRYNTKMNRALGQGPQSSTSKLKPISLEDAEWMHKVANDLGFATIEETLEHFTNVVAKEKADAAVKENEAYLEQYRKNSKDPKFMKRYEAEERAALAARPARLPDDQCDPSRIPEKDLYDWDTLQILAAEYPAVQVVLNDEPSPETEALKIALCFVLKQFGPAQWNQDHCVRMVQSLKMKIMKFWEANNADR